MALPLTYLVVRTLGAGGEAWELLFRVRVLETLGRTLLLAVAVTGASIALAVPLAWLTVRTDLPLRRAWSVLTVLPLVIPSYVGGFVVVAALGPRGMLQEFVAGPLGVDRLPEIYGFPGATLTLVLLSYPYVLLSVRGALWGLDPSLEETSSSLGQGARSTFFHVVLPQLQPAIAAGALLVALYTLSDFGAVSLLHFEAFSYVIYLQYDAGARTLAAASSLVLVVLALGLLLLEACTRGRSRYYRSTAGTVRPPSLVRLGRWRWPAFAFCGVVVLLALVMPIGVLGYWLGRGVVAGGVPGYGVEYHIQLGLRFGLRFGPSCRGRHTRRFAGSLAGGPLHWPGQRLARACYIPGLHPPGHCGRPGTGFLRGQLCHAAVPESGAAHLRLRGPLPVRGSWGGPSAPSCR